MLGVVFTAAYFLWKVIQKVLLGTAGERWQSLADLKSFEVLTLVPLAVLMIAIGIYPTWILDTINGATMTIMQIIGAA